MTVPVGVQRFYSPFHTPPCYFFLLPGPAYHHLYRDAPRIRMSHLTHLEPTISVEQSERRFELLNRATQTHTQLIREAHTGRGIDHHLLGLRLLMKSEDGETADLFSDEVFQRSKTWTLWTSALTAGNLFRGTGFGAQPSWYGINCE